MSKAVKALVVKEVARRLEGVDELLAATTIGLTAQEAVQFRAALRAGNVRALVVKNSLCSRAFEELELGYARPLLDGPTTLIYGGQTLVDTAKALVEAAKEFKVIEIHGGAAEGQLLSAADVRTLSQLPSKEEIVGQVVGGLLSQVSQAVGALTSQASQIAGQIEKIAERAEGKEAA
ncbi:MAG: 50S ribosomal protein L10 [Anaerolineaceae bacterium]|nr:50S ribosomal protein L10 [Anaerolineaceae bacterium]